MVHRPDLAEIRQSANSPEPPRLRALAGGDGGVFGNQFQDGEIDRLGSGAEDRIVAFRFETADQCADLAEIEIGIAPIDKVQRAEAIFFNCGNFFIPDPAALLAEAKSPEGTVLLVAPCAAGD